MQTLNEYPRPQLVRDSYICLNGMWDYAIRKSPEFPDKYDGKINVPFSPETPLSGVNKIVHPDEWLFYRTELTFPKGFIKDKVILHFGAVDQIAEVYINGEYVGEHIGGFLPFSFDIKPYITGKKDILTVRVKDVTDTSYYSRGKQSLKRGGIWYSPQSGIYMPVWMESVSEGYIEKLKITPDIDNRRVLIKVISKSKTAIIKVGKNKYETLTNIDFPIEINNPKLWTPENPYLYNFTVKTPTDSVDSYFAMRKISIVKGADGERIIALNNQPIFMRGVLDQGYYRNGESGGSGAVGGR
jgi:beta-galactosidase/beta-glucuronidase